MDNTISVWDASTGNLIHLLKGHSKPVTFLVISPDDSIIVSGSVDNKIRIWDVKTGILIHNLEGHTEPITSLDITSDSNTIVSGSADNTIRVWNASTGNLIHLLKGHSEPVTSLDISQDDSIIVSGSVDNTIRVWDINQGNCNRILSGHSDWISAVLVTPDSRKCISASYDNSLQIWDLLTGEPIFVIMGKGVPIYSLKVTPDSKKFIYISNDGIVRIFDLLTYRHTNIIDTSLHTGSSIHKDDKNKRSINKTTKDIRIAYEGEVIYDGKKTNFTDLYKNFLINQNTTMDVDRESLFHKDDSWEDEKEYRFVFNYSFLLNHRLTQLKPSAIYLGYRMSDDNINKVLTYCKNNKVRLFLYTPSFHSESSKKYQRTVLFDPKENSTQ